MEITVKPVDKEKRGAFVALADGKEFAGEMTYSRVNDSLIIIDHTETDPSYGGMGVGKQMVQAAIAWAKETETKVMPLCPFAKGYFEKHPEEVAEIIAKQG